MVQKHKKKKKIQILKTYVQCSLYKVFFFIACLWIKKKQNCCKQEAYEKKVFISAIILNKMYSMVLGYMG